MTEELQGRAAKVEAENIAATRPLTQAERDARDAGRPLTASELQAAATAAQAYHVQSKEEKLHAENARKAAERPKTAEELEAEINARNHAPGAAQKEAERNAALRALKTANEALGLHGLPLAEQPKEEPAPAATRAYRVTKDINTTINGKHIQAKEGEELKLTDRELLGVHGHVQTV